MESYVTKAETSGGGWVPLVMHHICTGSGCGHVLYKPGDPGFVLDLAARS